MTYAKIALWVAGAVLAAYEVYALYSPERGDTLSEIFWRAASRRPLVPFLLGLLCGHFVWQRGA